MGVPEGLASSVDITQQSLVVCGQSTHQVVPHILQSIRHINEICHRCTSETVTNVAHEIQTTVLLTLS